MNYNNSYDYLQKFDNLKNGFYEYQVNGNNITAYTVFEDRSGWIRVSIVDWNSQSHLNAGSVQDVKIDDDAINSLRTTHHEYNVKAEAHSFKAPFNDWLRYPHTLFVHNTMQKFSSVERASSIKNSNLVSLDENSKPIAIRQGFKSIGFGDGNCGDTFYAYGCDNQNGFYQSFSGAGLGYVFVR